MANSPHRELTTRCIGRPYSFGLAADVWRCSLRDRQLSVALFGVPRATRRQPCLHTGRNNTQEVTPNAQHQSHRPALVVEKVVVEGRRVGRRPPTKDSRSCNEMATRSSNRFVRLDSRRDTLLLRFSAWCDGPAPWWLKAIFVAVTFPLILLLHVAFIEWGR